MSNSGKPKPPPRFPVRKPASGNVAPAKASSSSQQREPVRSDSSQLRPPIMQGRAQASQMRQPVPGQGIITMRQLPGVNTPSAPADGPATPVAKPPSAPVKPPPSPPALPKAESGRRRAAPPPAEKKKRAPENMGELIRLMARLAIKHPTGMTVQEFDEKYVPRMTEMLPEPLRVSAHTVLLEHFLSFAHTLYVATVCGNFKERPVLCSVRALELACDLVERAQAHYVGDEDARLEVIRCKNLLVGLTLQAVRLLETARPEHEQLQGFTDNLERAVITVYGLKTQAEATGAAPWMGARENPLDKRIGAAINVMGNLFGEFIGKRASEMAAEDNQAVLAEFDGYMERFAPYIEGGRATAMERARQMSKNLTGVYGRPQKVEPLTIAEIKARPAGVEIHLEDKRVLFISTQDAKGIGRAAEGEVVDSRMLARNALEQRKQAKLAQEAEDEAMLMAELQQQVDFAKRARQRERGPSGPVQPGQ